MTKNNEFIAARMIPRARQLSIAAREAPRSRTGRSAMSNAAPKTILMATAGNGPSSRTRTVASPPPHWTDSYPARIGNPGGDGVQPVSRRLAAGHIATQASHYANTVRPHPARFSLS
jgi:hypothetical protein